MEKLGSAGIFLFDGFHLERRSGLFRLDQAGRAAPVALGSRAFDLLLLLVEHPGELVSKDEIMRVVWPGTVVEEGNLTVQISALRHILDQHRAQGSCIQTVPGRGYRFTTSVTKADATASAVSSAFSDSGEVVEGNRPSQVPAEPGGTVGSLAIPMSRIWDRFPRGVIATAISGVVVFLIALTWFLQPYREVSSVAPVSIVVLPFTDLRDDSVQRHFADGIVEDLTIDLSRIADLLVISRNTAFTYRNNPVDAKQVGRELGVRYVLEGSVRWSGSHLRINAQLIDAAKATHLWAERFEGATDDPFVIENEITRRIAVALKRALVIAEATRPTDHPEALDYIFRGRAVLMKPATAGNRAEAIALFERALALDPRSVAAQSLVARTLAARTPDPGETSESAAADIARAEELVGRALASSPHSPLAHYARGTILRAQDRFEEAIREYETVIAIDRNWAEAYAHLGQCKFYTGAIEEEILLVEQAIRLSPRDPMIGVWFGRIGLAHLLQSRIDEAIDRLERARHASPELTYVHSRLASAYALKGEAGRAAAELAEARKLSGGDRYSSIARLRAEYLGIPKVRALFEATYFAGLRLVGIPEE